MQNIKTTVKGDKLTLEIDLKTTLGPSKSGKTILVASSGGNIPIPGTDLVLGLNAYKAK
jgi:hypothetical protein